VIEADITDNADISRVECVLRTDASIRLLVNNAGKSAPTELLGSAIEELDDMIALNVTALVHLSYAALPGFVERAGGTIINIASVVAVAPELLNGVYGGTKAFVLAFSRSLQKEFGGQGIRVQTVLPGATATEFWDVSGVPLANLPGSMTPYLELMRAAIAQFGITETRQDKKENIVDWLLTKEIGGEPISRNLADAMATLIRLPSSQRGGAKRIGGPEFSRAS
jgi:short-subunit dehydrogenase